MVPVDLDDQLGAVLGACDQFQGPTELVKRKASDTLLPDRKTAQECALARLLGPLLLTGRGAQPSPFYVLQRHTDAVVGDYDDRLRFAGGVENLEAYVRRVRVVRVLDELDQSDGLVADQVLAENRHESCPRPKDKTMR